MDQSHIQNFLSNNTKKIFLKHAKFQSIVSLLEKELGIQLDTKKVEIKHTHVVLKSMSSIQKVFLKQHTKRILTLLQKEVDTIESIKFY
jgi:hypothetical protein